MLQTVLAIAGKPGLYKLVSRGSKNLIVESLDATRRRMPIFGSDKVISLADIAMYTDNDGEVPLPEVLQRVADKEDAKEVTFDYKKASVEDLQAYFAEILPDFDRDRVYPTDIKKLITWYNLLVNAGITNFVNKTEE